MSPFLKVLKGELPGFLVYEGKFCFALLALHQVQRGHCLVVPKREIDHHFEMKEEERTEFFKVAQMVSMAIQRAFQPKRVATAMIGLEVPHCHYHLIPIQQMSDFDFSKGRVLPADEMATLQSLVLRSLESLETEKGSI